MHSDDIMNTMTLRDIEDAITQLPRSELAELSAWFEDFEEQLWDEQIESDAKVGRFDLLIERARSDRAAGLSKPLLKSSIDFSDIPDSTPEELKRAVRVGSTAWF